MINFAERAYNHGWKIDPIIRSLLDDDFYVLTMQQLEWERHPNEVVNFAFKNRTLSVKLAEEIDLNELRAQLDHVRTLRFTPSEIIWLRGQTFYGQTGIFKEGYLDTLRAFHMPQYELEAVDGQIKLTSNGLWWQAAKWEMPFLTIVNELRYRAKMAKMSKTQLDRMYARAKVKLHDKLLRLANECPDLNLTDFGTRRRHSYLWQEYAVLTAKEVLGDRFTGTSNVHLAMKHDLEAKGSNAHQLPMVMTATHHGDPVAMRMAQYDVLKQWQNMYAGNMLVFLPDTYGTTQFLDDAPQWLSLWKGARPDSKEPFVAGEELISWWKKMGVLDLKSKLLLFSDGLDVHLPNYESNGVDIVALYQAFHDRAGVGFGFGTNFTCDFRGCSEAEDMSPISIVVKPESANGHPCVKLSDVRGKETGDREAVKYYRQIFGEEGVVDGSIPQV